MTTLQILIGLVAVQRLLELALARRNTARLMAGGAVETGARHYPLLVALHIGWLVTLAAAIPAGQRPFPQLILLFALLQVARLWIIVSLGPYWTTRLITVDAPLISRGPYRFVSHPNYIVVTAEIAVLPLAFGAWGIALVFTLLNALLLAHRVRMENRMLAARALTAAPTAARVSAIRREAA